VRGEVSRNSSGRLDPVLTGQRVDGVLLGVGRVHVRVVALGVRRGEVAAQLRGDVEVMEHVDRVGALGRAVDLDQAALGLPVLQVGQHICGRDVGVHQLPR
jgi:hypothetical protein